MSSNEQDRKEERKVWVLSQGDYSERSILGVYDNLEDLEEAKKFFATDDAEEYVLNQFPEHPKGTLPYAVGLTQGGALRHMYICDHYLCEKYLYIPSEYTTREGKDAVFIIFYLWARDDDHAIKIANERNVQLIARNEWTDSYKSWLKLLRDTGRNLVVNKSK